MRDTIYILFNRKGIRSLVKRTKTMKSLPSGTYIAQLNLEVNDRFFKNMIPEVNVKLSEEQIIKPEIKIKEERPYTLAMFFSRFEKKDRDLK